MPGDFQTLVKASAEKASAFNERLKAACEQAPITSFEAAVIDGQPVITLMSELCEADAEDVEEAKEMGGEEIKEGEIIPIGDTLCVQIAGLGASGENAAVSEKAMAALNKRAKGDCTEVRYFSGPFVQWVTDANDKTSQPKLVLASVPVTFAAVVYLQQPVEESAEEQAQGKK